MARVDALQSLGIERVEVDDTSRIAHLDGFIKKFVLPGYRDRIFGKIRHGSWVRTSTEIGAHSISMAAAAVRLASQLFEDLSQTKVLFVGAGEMIELVATHFAARAPKAMALANRTLERGEQLAGRFGGEAMRLSDMPNRLHEFDVVISCTASSLPIIGLGAVERALKARRRRPMFMVDLAVPRDIEPEVAGLSDVYLYTVDDLEQVIEENRASRRNAADQAQAAIGRKALHPR